MTQGGPRLLAALLTVLASIATVAGIGRAATVRPVAAGTIEGEVVLPNEAASKAADRYLTGNGEPRDIPKIPVVVHVEGVVRSAPAARPSAALELAQRGEAFDPQILVVPVGASVAFPNADPFFHNVFSYSRAKRFDLGRYRRGESKTVVFDQPGYIKVMCEVHKWMRAGIVVVENPYYAVVAESGRFRLDGVPAGRYRVVVEHFDRRPHVAEVAVPEGGTARLDVKL